MPTIPTEVKDITCRDFFVIAGPCVIESRDLCLRIAAHLAALAEKMNIRMIFKASFDKANRTSLDSYRGPGLEKGLEILSQVKKETGLPLLSDIHLPDQAAPAAEVLDVLQIPAFLCRQTDLLLAAAATGKVINVKKGQFLAPQDLNPLLDKIRSRNNRHIWLTERGSSFGYHNLVVDMRSFQIMARSGCPLIFDATHSVQLPGAEGNRSGGERAFIAPLAKAAVAAGAGGVFFETHPQPEAALCDGANSLPLEEMEPLLRVLRRVFAAGREDE
ncbi:MAG: 3-deoxy-8-phosphooctulonate synthase [Desulfarculales bacterium]|nr:3-deoxy-8-phosphooctulonate synthase [Desulfarculales bacterium]